MSDLASALGMLVEGLKLVGDAVTFIILFVLGRFGVQVPDVAIRLSTIILVVVAVWKLGNWINKIVLYAMIFLLISLGAGLIPSAMQALGF